MKRSRPFYHRGFLRRLTAGAPIVIVSGLPRSGTSMVMAMLQAGGIPIMTDGLRQPDEDNPRAYLEYERTKELHLDGDPVWLGSARGKAIKIVSYFLPYLPVRFDYRVLLVTRDLHEIMASQARMLRRRGETYKDDADTMLAIYADHLRKTRALLTAPHFSFIEVAYPAVVADPHGQGSRVAAFLVAHHLDPERMAAVVDPALYRNRSPSTP